MNAVVLAVAFLSVTLNALAQILLKAAASSFSAGIENVAMRLASSLLSAPGLFALGSYGLSILSWTWVLSKLPVSQAYPFISLGFVIVAVVSYFVFGERLDGLSVLGIVFISLGIVLVARN